VRVQLAVGVLILAAGASLACADRSCPADDAPPKQRAALKVGDKAPEVSGWGADGNALTAGDLAGKTVLVAFWQLDAKGGMPLGPLREVRRAAGDGVLILTVCVNGSGGNWDAWSKVLLDQGTVNYGDGARRFIDDAKWWNVVEVSSVRRASATAYGVAAYPEYFILKADGTVGGARVPPTQLKATIEKVRKR
jgi:hypothetical protein